MSVPAVRAAVLAAACACAGADAQQPEVLGETLKAQFSATLERVAATADGVVGYAIVDLASGDRFARLETTPFPTASTIKLAILYELLRQVDAGAISIDTPAPLDRRRAVPGGLLYELSTPALSPRDLAVAMMLQSDNTATNMLIGRLGTARVNETLDEYGIRNVRLFRPTFRDGRADVLPELERQFGLGMATPRDMARLMALIGQGKAVSPESSAAMLATLRQQQDRAMIPRLLPDDDVHVANKTGTDEEKRPGPGGRRGHVRADVAVVASPRASYAVAIYARHVEDERWGVDNDALVTGAKISRLIYEYFTGR